jgi:hypothetical protein
MKSFLSIILILASSLLLTTSFASEIGVAVPPIQKDKSIQPSLRFPGKLASSQFISSVDGAQNSWRAVLRDEGNAVRVGLKLGDWERPDSQVVNTLWLANNIDWAKVDKRYRDLEFTYTFGESTVGVQSIFKFGASAESVREVEGDCSFVLIYGENECTFRRGSDSTSGQLPFKITNGTTVRILMKLDDTVDIWIDDQPILADQVVDLRTNFVGIIANSDSPGTAHFLHLSALKAELVRAE